MPGLPLGVTSRKGKDERQKKVPWNGLRYNFVGAGPTLAGNVLMKKGGGGGNGRRKVK